MLGQIWGLLCVLIFILGMRSIRSAGFKVWDTSSQSLNYLEIGWRLVLPFLLFAAGARGTWTSHHLELQDSEQISNTPQLNELSLNALWTLDKNK